MDDTNILFLKSGIIFGSCPDVNYSWGSLPLRQWSTSTLLGKKDLWIKESHHLEIAYNTVWYWAKKLGGVIKAPRASRSQKDPAASETFKKELTAKLEMLNLPSGASAKIWIMDESRLGLHAHIVFQDGAGFHLRDGDPRVPANVRLIALPTFSSEFNSCEQLWGLIKDALGNRIFKTVENLRTAMAQILVNWWGDFQRVISLNLRLPSC